MDNLSNIETIKNILKRHGFSFTKALGQNFLINSSVCPEMASLCGAEEGHGIIEIGTGIGVLTRELANRADKVVCIEIDDRLLPILDETLKDYNNIKVINKDVLKVNLKELIEEEFGDMPVSVCANLPYYITSPIIMGILESELPIKSITVMVQKEAAIRLCAEAGTRAVGAVTIAVRYFSDPQILFEVSRDSFMPSPSVDSCVIRLDVLDKPSVDVLDQKTFFRVVKGAFAQRRKTLLNTLSSTLKISKIDLTDMLNDCELKLTARAEELSMDQFAKMADWIFNFSKDKQI